MLLYQAKRKIYFSQGLHVLPYFYVWERLRLKYTGLIHIRVWLQADRTIQHVPKSCERVTACTCGGSDSVVLD